MLDDTDRRILSVLQRDARASMRRISEEAGVSLGTVSNRVRRLEESGAILGYTVLLDPEMAGWELTVVIGCLLYTSPSPRDLSTSRMPSSA